MTPVPKYFVPKKSHEGNFMNEDLEDKIGKNAPNVDVTSITNIDEILAPM